MPYDSTDYVTPDTKPLTVADVLNRAADLIEERGHAKGALQDEYGGLCLFGAMLVASFGQARSFIGPNQDVYEGAANLVWKRLGQPVDWNNAPERTAGHCVTELRAAASAS